MKTLILFLCMALPCAVFSQDQDSVFQYCQVKIIGKSLSRKINIQVDYGQEQKVYDKSSIVKDQQGNVRTFNSIADALNYMGSLGWRVIQTYTIGADPSLSDTVFLMESRRKIIRQP